MEEKGSEEKREEKKKRLAHLERELGLPDDTQVGCPGATCP